MIFRWSSTFEKSVSELNKHDSWLRFCDIYREVVASCGLPRGVVQSEWRFRQFLHEGETGDSTMGALSVEQWSGLVEFAVVFFRECESCLPLEMFAAFRKELERRSSVRMIWAGDKLIPMIGG